MLAQTTHRALPATNIIPARPRKSAEQPVSNSASAESFQSGESRPDFMELGRKQWTFVNTGAASPTRVQKAMADPNLKARLARFGGDLQQQVSALSDPQLKVLKGGMSGTTEVGPVSVDNRKAFIKGSVAFRSIWGNVHQSITDARTKYSMINPAEEKALHKLIDSVSGLKPEQRKQLAELMDSVR